MKKSLLAVAVLLAGASNAHAIVGAKAGYNYWMTANHDKMHTVYGQFEHFIPLVPNAAVRYSTMDDKKLKFDSYDAYGYYEVLDNGNIALDLGFGLRRFSNGKLKGDSFSDSVPMLNAEAVFFEKSQMAFYGKMDVGFDTLGSDTSFTDFEAGVRFYTIAGLRVQAGYRNYKLELDGTKGIDDSERMRGFNVGLHWQF
ncbi:MAG: hypothetical protein ACR2PT_17895 [Endozoicomonas sp.]